MKFTNWIDSWGNTHKDLYCLSWKNSKRELIQTYPCDLLEYIKITGAFVFTMGLFIFSLYTN